MNSKEAGIYSITSKVNGKRYIGSASRICDRWINHKFDLKNNKHHSIHLQNHYNKYGEDDLIFSVIEIIERGDLTLQEFKKILLEKEQIYLNNWEECQFNCLKTAGSPLGHKVPNAKYYCYNKKNCLYQTYYFINGKKQRINTHYLEEDAVKEVNLIKTLSEQEIIKYYKESKEKPRKKPRGTKNYFFESRKGKYMVAFNINNKRLHFGYFYTEEEAIKQVEYINTLSTEEKIKYSTSKSYPKTYNRKSNSKYYTFNKARNKWIVQVRINGIVKTFDYFDTEQEAIDKVKELKIELGIK
jgi:hypothetical protein